MNIMGIVAFDLICRANSKPDPSGKPISRITRSQSPSFNFVNALCLVSTHATSYFSRSKRSCRVAPSERSSSTSNRRFIISTNLWRRLGCHGQFKLHDKAGIRATIKFDLAVHPLYQLTNDIKAHAAATATRVPHKKFAQLLEVAGKTLAVIRDLDHASIGRASFNADRNFGGM